MTLTSISVIIKIKHFFYKQNSMDEIDWKNLMVSLEDRMTVTLYRNPKAT